MSDLEQIGPLAELAQPYLARTGGVAELAAALFALDLMKGDPAELKAGYTLENAVIAACEVFPDVDQERVTAAVAANSHTKVTSYERGLIEKWEAGTATPGERLEVQKLGRVLHAEAKKIVEQCEGVLALLVEQGDEESASRLRDVLADYRETMDALATIGTERGTDGDEASD